MSKKIILVFGLLVFIFSTGCFAMDKPAEYKMFIVKDGKPLSWKVEPHPNWQNSLKPKKGAPSKTLKLTDTDNQANYTIIIPANPSTQDQKAAEELKLWLGVICDADFKVKKESESISGNFVSLGRTELLKKAQIPAAKENLNLEGYAIYVKDDNLYLFGGSARKSISAVIAFLEEDLGCRWWSTLVRGADGKPVSVDDNVKLSDTNPRLCDAMIPIIKPLNVSVMQRTFNKPTMPGRSVRHGEEDLNDNFSLRNRHSRHGILPKEWGGNVYHDNIIGFCHNLPHYAERNIEEVKKHPNSWALRDFEGGFKRFPPKQGGYWNWCSTDPFAIKHVGDEMVKDLKKRPKAKYIWMGQSDGINVLCKCDKCQKLKDIHGEESAKTLFMANKIAERLKHEFPQREIKIIYLAYGDTKKAPENIKAQDNIVISLAPAYSGKFPDIIKNDGLTKWAQVANSFEFQEYDNYTPMVFRPSVGNRDIIANRIKHYSEMTNVLNIHPYAGCEMRGNPDILFKVWLWHKLMWDASRDIEFLKDDFIYGYYGQVAEYMKKFYAELEKLGPFANSTGDESTRELARKFFFRGPFSKASVLKMLKFLDDAESAAKSDPVLISRVRREKMPILFLSLADAAATTVEEVDERGLRLKEFKSILAENNVTKYFHNRPEFDYGMDHLFRRLEVRNLSVKAVKDYQPNQTEKILTIEEYHLDPVFSKADVDQEKLWLVEDKTAANGFALKIRNIQVSHWGYHQNHTFYEFEFPERGSVNKVRIRARKANRNENPELRFRIPEYNAKLTLADFKIKSLTDEYSWYELGRYEVPDKSNHIRYDLKASNGEVLVDCIVITTVK